VYQYKKNNDGQNGPLWPYAGNNAGGKGKAPKREKVQLEVKYTQRNRSRMGHIPVQKIKQNKHQPHDKKRTKKRPRGEKLWAVTIR